MSELKRVSDLEPFNSWFHPKTPRKIKEVKEATPETFRRCDAQGLLKALGYKDAISVEQLQDLQDAIQLLVKVTKLPREVNMSLEEFYDIVKLLMENVPVLFTLRATDKGDFLLIAIPDKELRITKLLDREGAELYEKFVHLTYAININQGRTFVMNPMILARYHELRISW